MAGFLGPAAGALGGAAAPAATAATTAAAAGSIPPAIAAFGGAIPTAAAAGAVPPAIAAFGPLAAGNAAAGAIPPALVGQLAATGAETAAGSSLFQELLKKLGTGASKLFSGTSEANKDLGKLLQLQTALSKKADPQQNPVIVPPANPGTQVQGALADPFAAVARKRQTQPRRGLI